MVKAMTLGILAASLLISGTSACFTVDTPLQTADPTEDVGKMISAELTRVAPAASLGRTSTNTPPPDPTDTPPPESTVTRRPEPTATPLPTVTLQHLHSGPTIAELVARLRPSLAYIRTSSGSGSGFVYDRSGLVATNAHVVDCCHDVTVTVNNRHYQGTVLGRDDRADLAVVRINTSNHLAHASLGSARQVAVGDEVVALGFPLNLGDDLTATKGIVSSRRTLGGYEHFQHDAPINPGNSGGPLINLDGVVIGMNTSKRKDAEGVGFALSVGEMDGRLAALAGYAASPTVRPRPTATQTPIPTYRPASTTTPQPTRASPARDFQQVSAGVNHTCGLKGDGSIVCWGSNEHGQSTPPSGTFQQISAGWHHTCGLKTDSKVACWGKNHNSITGDTDGRTTPPSSLFQFVSAGGRHTCGVRRNGYISCWGSNEDTFGKYLGQATPPTGNFVKVSAGLQHTCGVKPNGNITCWGDNNDRYGYAGQSVAPTGIYHRVSTGAYHSCAIKTNGSVVCWGSNNDRHGYSGQSAPPSDNFQRISAGIYHTCGINTNGEAICWGSNKHLIRDDVIGHATPPKGFFREVSAGGFHSCGVQVDNDVVCWGSNRSIGGEEFIGQSTPP